MDSTGAVARAKMVVMPLVRILVDGFSLLHRWPAVCAGRAPHSAFAREALVTRLTHYRDAIGTPLTIFFDGQGAPAGTPRPASSRQVEVIYSPPGKTADDLIERVAYRLREYGHALVVTDDLAERDTVLASGAWIASCGNFIAQVEAELGDMAVDLRTHNRREREGFRRGHG